MAEQKRSKTLEIDQNLIFQKRQWLFERLGWVVMSILVLAAIGGLFGHGLFSTVHHSTQTITVSYDKFARMNAPTSLQVDLLQQENLRVDQEFFNDYQIESIHPQPEKITYEKNSVLYSFPSKSNTDRQKIVFRLQPNKIGVIETQIGTNQKGGLTLQQIVYP